MRRIGFFILGLNFFFNASVIAKDDLLIINDYRNSYNPALLTYFLIDQTNNLKISDITSSAYQDKFRPNSKEIPHFGLESSSIWLRFQAQNLLSTSPYLEIENPALDTLEYYLVNKLGSVVHHYITGNHARIENRTIRSGELMINLSLADNDIYYCYLKINSYSSTLLAPMRIASLKKFYELNQSESVWQGLYFGLILFLFIYNVFLSISLKDLTHLHFALLIASMGLLFALFKGFGMQYLWNNFPEINQLTPFIGAVAGIFMILFSAKFLDSKEKTPTLHIWLLALIGLYAFVIILNILGFQYLSINLIIYNSMLGLMFLMFLAIKAWRDGYEPAKFCLLAWSFYVIGIFTSFLRDNNLIEVNIIVGSILQITSTISILFMSFALSKKINIYIRNKNTAQELAFEAATENERLISNQKQLLEAKVYQRTIDLEQTIKTLNNQHKELEYANIFKDKVFSIISHDLKSPIATLAGMLNLMKLKSLSDLERTNILDQLEIALKNTKNLLDNILNWAYKNKSNQNEKEPIDLKRCVDNIFSLFQHQANDKKIIFKNKIKDDLCILANENMIQLILRNLVSNAIKFTPKGGSVHLDAKTYIHDIHITVKDTGIGMDQETQLNIFNIEKSNSSRGTENEQGTGLGLLLCKEFIDKFNGEITVKSTPERGSTFIIKLQDAIPSLAETVP